PAAELYPNPAVDEVTVRSQGFLEQVSVIDLLGQEVKTLTGLSGHEAKVSLTGLQAGTYFVVAVDTEGKKVQTLVIE
ncbi:MAG TPA: hypothetical protein DCE41_10400, partial [Cytophagales bacterium]|nr:hypothetical protein [Cytophagales bacterium]